jgi:hypothetical protein
VILCPSSRGHGFGALFANGRKTKNHFGVYELALSLRGDHAAVFVGGMIDEAISYFELEKPRLPRPDPALQ